VLLALAIVANLWLVFVGNSGVGTPMGDLYFAYQPWANQVMQQNLLLGISVPWVYPYPALVPMLLANLAWPGHLADVWLAGYAGLMLATLSAFVLYKPTDAAALKRRYLAAYTWVGLTVALGPVAISRIDSISVLLAMMGALAIVTGSRVGATAFFTFASWLKIWPIAMFVAIASHSKNWLKPVQIGAAISAGILFVGVVIGGNGALLSFVTGQTSRGIQIESPVATPWLIAAALGAIDAGNFYNQKLMTFEAFGPGTSETAFWLGPIQAGALLITIALGFLANRKAVTQVAQNNVIVWTAFTATLDLIFFNKVGSPQFMAWLAVPVVLGILLGVERWRLATGLVFAMSLVTWLIYPAIYGGILGADLGPTMILVFRNLLELAALVYANYRLNALAMAKN
jgi:hypothetical protein